MKKICVFCGSSKPENNIILKNEVISLGKLMLSKRIELIYGGAKIGLMGLIAKTILDGNGKVTGVIPKILSKKEIINKDVTELIVTKNMHERKKIMVIMIMYGHRNILRWQWNLMMIQNLHLQLHDELQE